MIFLVISWSFPNIRSSHVSYFPDSSRTKTREPCTLPSLPVPLPRRMISCNTNPDLQGMSFAVAPRPHGAQRPGETRFLPGTTFSELFQAAIDSSRAAVLCLRRHSVWRPESRATLPESQANRTIPAVPWFEAAFRRHPQLYFFRFDGFG